MVAKGIVLAAILMYFVGVMTTVARGLMPSATMMYLVELHGNGCQEVSAHHQHDMYLLGVITMVARDLMPCATIMYQVGMLTTVGAGSYHHVSGGRDNNG